MAEKKQISLSYPMHDGEEVRNPFSVRVRIPKATREAFKSIKDSNDILNSWVNWAFEYILADDDLRSKRRPPPTRAEKQAFIDAINGTEETHGVPYLPIEVINDDKHLLTYATENKQYWAMEALLKAGANPSKMHHLDYPPIYYAVENGDMKALKMLVENPHGEQKAELYKGKGDDRLHIIACKKNRPDILQYLYENKYDIGKRGESGNALHIAARHGSVEAVGWLLEEVVGADKPIKINNRRQVFSALTDAARSEKNKTDPECIERIVTMLLEHGARFNAKDMGIVVEAMSHASLKAMLAHDRERTMELLKECNPMSRLSAHSDSNMKVDSQANGMTLKIAIDRGSPFIQNLKLLVELGFDPGNIKPENVKNVFVSPMPATFSALQAAGAKPEEMVDYDFVGNFRLPMSPLQAYLISQTQRKHNVDRGLVNREFSPQEQQMQANINSYLRRITDPTGKVISPGDIMALDYLYEQKDLFVNDDIENAVVPSDILYALPGDNFKSYWTHPHWKKPEHAKQAVEAMEELGSDWCAEHMGPYQRLKGQAQSSWVERTESRGSGWVRE